MGEFKSKLCAHMRHEDRTSLREAYHISMCISINTLSSGFWLLADMVNELDFVFFYYYLINKIQKILIIA